MENSVLGLGGSFYVEHYNKEGELLSKDELKNIVVNEGLNHALNVVLNAQTQVSTWYLGIFEGNYTPVSGDTAATFPASATECTAYDEAARPTYVEAASTAQSITNSANKAQFSINATKTVYGAFLSSASGKGATSGVLLAAAKFGASKNVSAGDVLLVTYTINATSS